MKTLHKNMLNVRKVLFLLLFTNISQTFTKMVKPPTFKDQYEVQGTLYIPHAEIKEPFYAWYDAKRGSSRIDYYGGMVKTIQLRHYGRFGSSIKLVPITTESVTNQESCFKARGSRSKPVAPQTVLPSTEEMKFIGMEIVNGYSCEKWEKIEIVDEAEDKFTLWIRRKSSKSAIPVRFEKCGFNSLLGSHFDHFYYDYDIISFKKPDPEVFEIADNYVDCSEIEGEDHFNPFILLKTFNENNDDHDRYLAIEFEKFKSKYQKFYPDQTNHENRQSIFKQNLEFIKKKNDENLGYTLKVNQFADWTAEEMKSRRGKLNEGLRNPNYGLRFPYQSKTIDKLVKTIPKNFDWRLYGAVTSVKDQSDCGCCWAFGSTGAIEGAYFIKYKKLLRLSQQSLVDCSWGFGNKGCDGGEDFQAYEWIREFGIPTDEEYGSYLAQDGYCHIENVSIAANLIGFVNVPPVNSKAMKLALFKHGPISTSVNSSPLTFNFYSNGVYYDPECSNSTEDLNHVVLVVGYGVIEGENYWLAKNSWSNYWGNDGYILISQRNNNCGVLNAPTYVEVE